MTTAARYYFLFMLGLYLGCVAVIAGHAAYKRHQRALWQAKLQRIRDKQAAALHAASNLRLIDQLPGALLQGRHCHRCADPATRWQPLEVKPRLYQAVAVCDWHAAWYSDQARRNG